MKRVKERESFKVSFLYLIKCYIVERASYYKFVVFVVERIQINFQTKFMRIRLTTAIILIIIR